MRTHPMLLAAAALLSGGTAYADAILHVGTGAGCDHATIQHAIDAVDNANGTTWIRITRSLAYADQQLDINGKNVVLTGGYSDCQQSVEDATHTILTGINGTVRPVITVRGNTQFVGIYKLDIGGNHNTNAGSGAGFGGGIAVLGGPHRLVGLGGNSIDGNRANLGGGLYVRNDFSANPADVRVLIGADVAISNNQATGGGGGVFCSGASAIMSFPNSAIIANSTSGGSPGGGIRAERCAIDIGGASAGLGSISFNTAGGDGGGISASASSVRLYTTDPANPTLMTTNIAGGVGGAIAIDSNSLVSAWDIIVEGNIGRSGGGAIAIDEASDDGIDSALVMRGDLLDAPDDAASLSRVAVLCNATLRCNRLAFNAAIALDGSQMPGAAVLARSAGDGSVDNLTSLAWFLFGTEVYSNSGLNIITSDGDFADASLRGVALFNNVATANLVELAAPGTASFGMYASTIAGNTSAGDRSIHRDTGVALDFHHSIHWQPGKRIQSGVGSFNVDIDYAIANDLSNVAPSTHNLVADPLFVDAAAQDYRLQLASPALDYAPSSDDPAAGHLPRVVDLLPVTDEFGPQDAGAYERQTSCGDDTIFCSGFEA